MSQSTQATSLSYQDNLSTLVLSTKSAINAAIKSVIQYHQLPPDLERYGFSKLGYVDTPIDETRHGLEVATIKATGLAERMEDIDYDIHTILREHGVNFLEDMVFEHRQENPDCHISILESNHFTHNDSTSAINAIKCYLMTALSSDNVFIAHHAYQGSDPVHEGLFDHHPDAVNQKPQLNDESDEEGVDNRERF